MKELLSNKRIIEELEGMTKNIRSLNKKLKKSAQSTDSGTEIDNDAVLEILYLLTEQAEMLKILARRICNQ